MGTLVPRGSPLTDAPTNEGPRAAAMRSAHCRWVGAARRSSRSDRERDHVRFPARTRNVARPDQVGGPHAMEHDPKLVAGTLAEFFAAEH